MATGGGQGGFTHGDIARDVVMSLPAHTGSDVSMSPVMLWYLSKSLVLL